MKISFDILADDLALSSIVPPVVRRGAYGEIASIDGVPAASLLGRYRPALPDLYIDGGKRWVESVNVDLYGYDADQEVAVVQARQFSRDKRRGWTNMRKTYFLCGFNEITRAPFRHPVSHAAVLAAARKRPHDAVAPVRAAQRWMWQCTERQLADGIRQGDVLLVRERGEPKGVVPAGGDIVIVGGSHEVHARRIAQDGGGMVYALNPLLVHTKHQHDPVTVEHDGWYSVRVAREQRAWSFASRLGD